MPISSLPNECFNNVLSFLDRKSLYKSLFVNSYYCKCIIPLIWREPFIKLIPNNFNPSLINTLLACLNEDEISSLIPCAMKFNNDQFPLFEYGKFVRKFTHESCVYISELGLNYQNIVLIIMAKIVGFKSWSMLYI